MKVAIRGYKKGYKIFEERVDEELDDESLKRLDAKLLANAPHMIEIEFLEELDPLRRFFRFGTDAHCDRDEGRKEAGWIK